MSSFPSRFITAVLLGLFFWSVYAWLPAWVLSVILFAMLAEIIFFEWTRLFAPYRLTFWLLMPFYPILPFTLAIILNQDCAYRQLLWYLVVLVCSFDIGSYLFGKMFGHTKIAPATSPGKTWEGFLGGYASALGVLTLVLWKFCIVVSTKFLMGFTFVVCFLALLGDLFESSLKRRARIKDSGFLLPGHGGFLDRFDGLLFAVVIFYFWRDFLVDLLVR